MGFQQCHPLSMNGDRCRRGSIDDLSEGGTLKENLSHVVWFVSAQPSFVRQCCPHRGDVGTHHKNKRT